MTPEQVRNLRHDLRTPVNHLIGYAELILEEDPVPPALAARLEAVRSLGRECLEHVAALVGEDSGVAADARQALDRVVGNLEAEVPALLAESAATAAEDAARMVAAIGRLRELVATLAITAGQGRTTVATAEPDLAAPTVLVVDDDAANRDVLGRRMARLGYTVRQAENGAEALEVLASGGIDLVLLDVMMPVLDGFGVLARRQEDPALRDIPVLMISALDQLESVARCIELGADDYLTKPFDPVVLKARAAVCVERKRLRDRERALLSTVTAQAEELRALNRELEQRVDEKVREVERLSLMQRFIPPQLAEALASGGVELLQSHRREITVLFCDLRGFTSFAETTDPEDVMTVLGELHASLGPLVFKYGGTLAQFTGDGMMIFFNDPVACDEPAWQAVQLALEMQAAIAPLALGWQKRGHHLEMGVGIAVGYATCGQVGFEGRYEYTAIGTVTNLAARLCGEARGGQTLASERVFRLIEERVKADHAGDLVLKGFARPVPAYSIDGLQL